VIEEVLRGAEDVQPPSLYISVTSPLEIWAIPSSFGSRIETLFYKVPHVKGCDSIFELANPCDDTEEVLSTIKVEPRMAR
jgi:hypothetical protein